MGDEKPLEKFIVAQIREKERRQDEGLNQKDISIVDFHQTLSCLTKAFFVHSDRKLHLPPSFRNEVICIHEE